MLRCASYICVFFMVCMRVLQIKRPSKYDSHTAMMLGPVSPDPTIDLRGLVMVKQAGAVGGGEQGMLVTGRYERNWNTLYVGGLPMDWGEMQVGRPVLQHTQMWARQITITHCPRI